MTYRPTIGLKGLARAGKDTVAGVLIDECGYTRIAFADKLRECLLALDPLIPIDLGWESGQLTAVGSTLTYERLSHFIKRVGWDEAKANYEVRRLLQRLGTEVGRDLISKTLWIDLAFSQQVDGPVVFSDVRFPDEAKAICDLDGFIIELIRPAAGLDGTLGGHASETQGDQIAPHYRIINDGTLEDLAKKIRDIMADIDLVHSFNQRHGV